MFLSVTEGGGGGGGGGKLECNYTYLNEDK